ncbi:MAG: helicase-related protein [Candidatus Xenobia bacterium]
MNFESFWKSVDSNCQRIALRDELIEEGESFALTEDQHRALEELYKQREGGVNRAVLKGPTGCGKTEVLMRLAVGIAIEEQRPVWLLAPTRDLLRQHENYFQERLEQVDVPIAAIHGGVAPKDRDRHINGVRVGQVDVVMGSALVLEQSRYRQDLDDAALIIMDDVHAFDEEEHLCHLRQVKAPVLYVSATPEAVGGFLRREGAMQHLVEMHAKPFPTPSTIIHKVPCMLSENVFGQLDRSVELIQKHLHLGSRIYVLSRTRTYVPLMADYLERQLQVPVSILHGDMADTQEHRKRLRRFSGNVAQEDRRAMMERFRKHSPAIMVATNLIGSGLDIPLADLIVITDSDSFGEAELEQLVGRVGRRERASDAVMLTGTTLIVRDKSTNARGSSIVRNGRMVMSYRPRSLARGRR